MILSPANNWGRGTCSAHRRSLIQSLASVNRLRETAGEQLLVCIDNIVNGLNPLQGSFIHSTSRPRICPLSIFVAFFQMFHGNGNFHTATFVKNCKGNELSGICFWVTLDSRDIRISGFFPKSKHGGYTPVTPPSIRQAANEKWILNPESRSDLVRLSKCWLPRISLILLLCF